MWHWLRRRMFAKRTYLLSHHIALYLVRNCPKCGGTDLNPPRLGVERCEHCSPLHNALLDNMEI